MPRKKQFKGVFISTPYKKKLDDFAEKTGYKKTWIVENAIDEYIKKHDKKGNK